MDCGSVLSKDDHVAEARIAPDDFPDQPGRLDLGHVLVRDDIEPQPQLAQLLQGREAEIAPRLGVRNALEKRVPFRLERLDALLEIERSPLDGLGVEPRIVAHLPAALRTGEQEFQRLAGLGGRAPRLATSFASLPSGINSRHPRAWRSSNRRSFSELSPAKVTRSKRDDAHTASSSAALAPACCCLTLASLEVTTAARSASPR